MDADLIGTIGFDDANGFVFYDNHVIACIRVDCKCICAAVTCKVNGFILLSIYRDDGNDFGWIVVVVAGPEDSFRQEGKYEECH